MTMSRCYIQVVFIRIITDGKSFWNMVKHASVTSVTLHGYAVGPEAGVKKDIRKGKYFLIFSGT